MENQEPSPEITPKALPLVEAIRAASKGGALVTQRTLEKEFPDLNVHALITESGVKDLKKMEGSSDVYYFSDLSMTEAYAVFMYRINEKDPVRLIAETVRDDSRIYPRPTPVATFREPPFSLSARDVEEALGRMTLRPDLEDIKRSSASNGALYLYSSQFLSEAQGDALTEWFEVGVRENP
ncbi:MAG: hypothetical protein FD137_2000 [Spirochaetes bacterium]|nr:MAG: hypothetical protein FD137_2000 [Spirochaetota bacterium]